MDQTSRTDQLLIERIRDGESDAWSELIARFEGRLLAFVRSRIGDRTAAEDVVQESFIGFLTSLPNFDARRSLESWLFSIASHKLTDYLRRTGRRPSIRLSDAGPRDPDDNQSWEPPANARPVSSMMRSGERHCLEETALVHAIDQLVTRWRERGDWTKLRCVELLFVRSEPNKEAARLLGVTQQDVANYKFEFIAKLRSSLQRMNLSEDVFPELYEQG